MSESASASAAGLISGDKANPTFKIIGISLAIGSGVFIGASFVVKKKGLLSATKKYGNQAGEGHAYLKNWIWWTGMIMMVIGEVLNFVAYAFTEAILVTPMGALSVVISAILSHFFLGESLTFFGWIGCTLCILGATILALNAPEQQSVTTIESFKRLFIAPGFLTWASICIVASVCIKFFVVPKYGRQSMLPFITICSLIGGISVSCTQGLGASIVTSIGGDNQVKNWFFWFLFVFVVVTLLIEINYLNKALEIYYNNFQDCASAYIAPVNTAMVVPVYFVMFTTCVLITSFILYQGLKASAITLITMVMGFLVICLGITLLQMSKVDPKNFNLDRRSTMLMQASRQPDAHETEKEEVTQYEDPGMDALRGGFGAVGSIIRARSVSRRMSRSQSVGQGRWFDEAYDPPGMMRASISNPSGQRNLSTVGMENLKRYQLSDTPMPDDAKQKIAQHLSPTAPTVTTFGKPEGRNGPHLKFDEEDVVHQYDPAGYDRMSASLPHSQLHVQTSPHHLTPTSPGHNINARSPSIVTSPAMLRRAPSGIETVEESPDEYNFTVDTAQRARLPVHTVTAPSEGGGHTRYSVAPDQTSSSGYRNPYSPTIGLGNPNTDNLSGQQGGAPSSPRTRSASVFSEGGFARSLGSVFNFHPSPDLSLQPPTSTGSDPAIPMSGTGTAFGSHLKPPASPKSGSWTDLKGASMSRKASKDAEEEERRGLVEAQRTSDELNRAHGEEADPSRGLGVQRVDPGLSRIETNASQITDPMSSPEGSPVKPMRPMNF